MRTSPLGIQIDSDVPLPRSRGTRSTYPWAELEVGESFFIPDKKLNSTSGSASYFEIKTGFKYTRRSENGGVRVWRIS